MSDVLVLTIGEAKKPSTYYRVHALQEHWEACGLSVKVLCAAGESAVSFATQLKEARRAGVVLIQKRLYKPWRMKLLYAVNDKLIYDYDDALFEFSDDKRKKLGSRADKKLAIRVKRLEEIFKRVRMVFAGNSYLAKYAKKHNSRVEIIPTGLEAARYTLPLHKHISDKPIIGWIGSGSSVAYLEICRSAIAKAVNNGAQFHVISNVFPDWPEVEMRKVQWTRDGEVDEVRAFDIGLMPLSDSPYARGKCAFKALQYMALGVVPVVSPVGVNETVVVPKITGAHATDTQWAETLNNLAINPKLRTTLGKNAREEIENNYTTEALGKRTCDLLKTIIDE